MLLRSRSEQVPPRPARDILGFWIRRANPRFPAIEIRTIIELKIRIYSGSSGRGGVGHSDKAMQLASATVRRNGLPRIQSYLLLLKGIEENCFERLSEWRVNLDSRIVFKVEDRAASFLSTDHWAGFFCPCIVYMYNIYIYVCMYIYIYI